MNVNWESTYLYRNNLFMNYTHYFETKSHVFYQQVFCRLHSIFCFLQVLCPITNHRFNIKDFCCSTNYKMRKVKQYIYLQNPQLVFDTPTYTRNPCLIQFQSILLIVPLCMLTLVWIHPRISSENKNKTKNIQITATTKS